MEDDFEVEEVDPEQFYEDPKRPNNRFTDLQTTALKEVLKNTLYPSTAKVLKLVEELELAEKKVREWFKRQRSKLNNIRRKKTSRVTKSFTDNQWQILHQFFTTNKYPTAAEREYIAQCIDDDKERVMRWFQKQRSSLKKKEITEPTDS